MSERLSPVLVWVVKGCKRDAISDESMMRRSQEDVCGRPRLVGGLDMVLPGGQGARKGAVVQLSLGYCAACISEFLSPAILPTGASPSDSGPGPSACQHTSKIVL